ncbi:IS66 family transposase [Ligilactobacillus acidipiscis]|uniref:IS66 family transposase n=1 Tax=Ligilactobacillus acidipiscis TaxID=89059 RepID=UPI0022E26448|nr:IS66 family transposase [Ligilactobacillus acidipiscis]
MEQEKTREELIAENAAQAARIKELEEMLQDLQRKIFGTKSEKSVSQDPDQLSLFEDEPVSVFTESELTDQQSTQETKKTGQKPQKRRKSQAEQLAGLPVSAHVYHHESGLCPFGHPLKVIGKKFVGQKVHYRPAKLWVTKEFIENYSCDCEECFAMAGKTAFYSAQRPEKLLPGSPVTPELLSNIVYQKYSLGTPLYRQLSDWQRLNWETSESTLARLVVRGSQIVQPLYNLLHRELLKALYLKGDETVIQVLREPGKKPTSESRMWVMRTIQNADEQGVFYAYRPDRSTKSAQELYAGFAGVLQCDGYSVYSAVNCQDRVGCWAHVRRKFFDAAKHDVRATEPLKLIDRMFHLEKQWRDLDASARAHVRQVKLAPVLASFWNCLAQLPALPKSALGKAIYYASGQKSALDKLLQYGAFDLSNNTCEQAVKSLVIDRKNFLFSTSVAGAKANAIWLTLLESAKANGLDPQRYLTEILTAFSQRDFSPTETELQAYLPWQQNKKQEQAA